MGNDFILIAVSCLSDNLRKLHDNNRPIFGFVFITELNINMPLAVIIPSKSSLLNNFDRIIFHCIFVWISKNNCIQDAIPDGQNSFAQKVKVARMLQAGYGKIMHYTKIKSMLNLSKRSRFQHEIHHKGSYFRFLSLGLCSIDGASISYNVYSNI